MCMRPIWWKVILSRRHFIQKVPIWFKQHHGKSHQNVIIMPLPQMNHHDFYARCAFVKGLRWKLSKRKFITEHNPYLYTHPSFLSSGLSRNSLVLVWRKFWRILKQHYLFFPKIIIFNVLFPVHWLVTGRMSPLPLPLVRLAWYNTIQHWLPAWHPFAKSYLSGPSLGYFFPWSLLN